MPAPGATPMTGQDAMDLGNGLAATRYSDGSYVVWRIDPPHDEVAYIEPGTASPADLGNGQAAYPRPDGSLDVFDINNPPPRYGGTAAGPGTGTGTAGGTGQEGMPRPGTGRYPATIPGQTQRGSVPFGSTVAAGTWNPPGQGRGEGWGSIGAGTVGLPYGWGVPGFGEAPVKLAEKDLGNLLNPDLAPGYIPGSGTYNQYSLAEDPKTPGQSGLFGPVGPQGVMSNLRYGLGGTGDPTTGAEIQTPQRWITGNAADSAVALQGDERWRREHGMAGAPAGGGGWNQSWQSAVPAYRPGPGVSSPPPSMGAFGATNWQPPVAGAWGGSGGGSQEAGGGAGGGFFGSTVPSNWGQTPETAGKDYIGTLFLRSDTPTGISTAAWSAPPQFWQGLAQEIAAGRVTITDPQAWEMLAQKGYTPQTIGGAALTGVQPGAGGPSGGSLTDAVANANAAAAADRAAYWAYQQSLVRDRDQGRALEEARDAWTKAYQTAGLTGQFNGADTMAMQNQRFTQGVTEAGLTGQYNGQDTMAKIAQQNQTALGLLGLQSQLRGPQDWAKYQSTFSSTPQGLRDVMAAFQGRYQLPTGQSAGAGAQGGQASVAGLGGDILSGTYGSDGLSGIATMNPRQADLQNWARMAPSQRQMIIGQAEQSGWYGPDYEKMLQQAAPKYAGPSSSSFNFFQS